MIFLWISNNVFLAAQSQTAKEGKKRHEAALLTERILIAEAVTAKSLHDDSLH